jgi:hypothetical protein
LPGIDLDGGELEQRAFSGPVTIERHPVDLHHVVSGDVPVDGDGTSTLRTSSPAQTAGSPSSNEA